MDTEKRPGLVKRHEQIDARVWNQFFGTWWPLAPWSELSVTYRADLGVDQGTVTVPYSHPCASIFRQVRDGVPAPISIEVNGVFISGQITTAQAERAEETQVWRLTMQTDAKHAHSMMARPMVQSAADNAETQLRGFLGPMARQLIGLASSRTGLPTYVCVDGEGDPVDLVARTEDTVADVLADAVAGSDLFVDVRVLLPGQELPGGNTIERFAGPVERQWENAALDAGLWPHAEHHERLVDVAEGPNGVIPPFSWHGVASVNHVGEPLEEPIEGYVWVPFATQAPYIGSEYYNPDRPKLDGSRVITDAALDSHSEKFPGWASFVTEWKPGAVFAEVRENQPLHEAAKVGLLKLPDGTKLPASWSELGPLLVDYVGLNDYDFTTPGVFAWRDGATWVLANSADMEVEKAKRAANVNQRQTPGVLFHFYPERDRRGIIFSSVPGGGLKSWSATYTAPEGAMLIAAARLDEWTMNQMGLGTLPEQAVTGEQSATPVDASTMKNIPATVDQIDVDVQPQARLEGSDIAYHAAGGRVDIGKAGPFFYREKYLNLGNSGTINPVQQMAQEWSRAQGSTTVQLTPSGRGNAVFGDDIVGDDGRRIPGWRHGDRVSFVDGDTRISEVIVGWTLTANAGEPLEVSPILGREDNGVLAQLGERIRGAEREAGKTAISPPRRISPTQFSDSARESTGIDQLSEEVATQVNSLENTVLELHKRLQEIQAEIVYVVSLNGNETRGDFTTITTSSQFKLVVDGNWVGQVVATIDFGRTMTGDTPGGIEVYTWDVGAQREFTVSKRGVDTVKYVRLDWNVNAGTVIPDDKPIRSFMVDRSAWHVLHTVTAPDDAECVLSMRTGWHRATFDNKYGIRVQLNGSLIAQVEPHSGLGPRLIYGGGYRTQSITQRTITVTKDDVVTMEAWSGAHGTDQRTIRDADLKVSWITA